MPVSMEEFLKSRRIRQLVTCQVGDHLIPADQKYKMLNDKPICIGHYEDTLPEPETGGRGVPHGGCVADPTS